MLALEEVLMQYRRLQSKILFQEKLEGKADPEDTRLQNEFNVLYNHFAYYLGWRESLKRVLLLPRIYRFFRRVVKCLKSF